MPHPLVIQHRFTRSEFQRGLAGLTAADAEKRLHPMNAISWMIAHLAWQEQRYWLQRAQGITLVPEVITWAANGAPASIPPLADSWQAWEAIVAAGDPYLDTLTNDLLASTLIYEGKPVRENVGTMLRRTTYHYWYHLGEAMAVRQLLGHSGMADFVGDLGEHAPYVAE
jgi:hypothetical protein